ncbi:MAG: succinate-semialdehyde dehydrogenase [Gallionellales bacterium RIFCSPLOWO2_12_FULL_57_18]|nr:MAG: succinate-semialdehyde dehydrogenase [Gallionellales bacterium RIFCSPLOWO2_12_FULL_57_18]OGS96768.1 MAG: succinate-semialdehyde dehydrogenase [Gallionellales bacterium RIFCSPLOWO2_02_FULL_57_47]OGT17652.1 MAG: succinate-semialdehyde dehydrogenase [Gallionellales bacterium RIFCSPHIGHO2_02_FULL_57_16]
MPHVSLNPAVNQVIQSYSSWDARRLEQALENARNAQQAWAQSPFDIRAKVLREVAIQLRAHRDRYATLITLEMGKLLREARAEVEKCAGVCDYYAQHTEVLLRPEAVETDAGKSYIAYYPLGVVLAVMPWNFPFWQVFRAAVPALMAGNALLLKHAPNVPQCALAIEAIFRESGLPEGLFTSLMIEVDQAAFAIASPQVHAVTLTGSEAAGRKVAALAGQHLKKCVLELGGSDPFIVLHDADLELAVNMAVASRFLNCGQSCIAAKRFIVVPQIAEEFLSRLTTKVAALRLGEPMDDATQIGPMARLDLREALHRQVTDSIAQGAVAVTGCKPVEREGFYYQPSILDQVTAKACAYHDELFGPVAIVIRAANETDALRIANENRFGLGSSIWSSDVARAEQLAARIEAGCTFINGMVKSDPRLPFGGVKASGYGRELSKLGIHEFVNAKTVWIR